MVGLPLVQAGGDGKTRTSIERALSNGSQAASNNRVPQIDLTSRGLSSKSSRNVRGNQRMRLSIGLYATLFIASAGVAHAATPLACEVDARSTNGGRVWISRIDHSPKMPLDMPRQVVWQPPSSSDAIKMGVGSYGGKVLGELTGGHVMFTPGVMADAGNYTIRVRSKAGDLWTYSSADLEVGPEKASVGFDGNEPRGRAILAALSHGTPITLEILQAGKIEQSDTFDPSNINERDKLVAYASHLVEINDPRVCKAI